MAKQKVFVVVPVSERLPNWDTQVIWSMGGNLYKGHWTEVEGRKWICLYPDDEGDEIIRFSFVEIDFWLKERELHVFTDEELEAYVEDRFIQRAKTPFRHYE